MLNKLNKQDKLDSKRYLDKYFHNFNKYFKIFMTGYGPGGPNGGNQINFYQ